ncbi:hypothetical protein [Flexivirga caeni]|uniref:Uncharacterized protein n=1 Tax=Flexivirga caeni TaxID=2294115 RepID=A0A3M9LYA4_9MICO|nr:hypothetical protein [Flexivirga caeni]RNI17957.1 hypothetical protein EFY87_18810 [Flexivirga caeni]
MVEAAIPWERLGALDYEALRAKPDSNAVAAYRAWCEVPGYDEATGFDEQKAPVPQHKPDKSLWRQRYRLGAFAQANGLTYSFRSNPKRWPGMLTELPRRWGGNFRDLSKIRDVLEGSSTDGRRFMACAMELTQCGGAVTGRDIIFNHFTVVAVQTGIPTKQAYLKHRLRKHPDAQDPVEGNFSLDNLFHTIWTPMPEEKAAQYRGTRRVLTPELLELILRIAPGHNLFLSGDWLYVMKPYSFRGEDKKNADPDVLRERFEIAAQLGPALAEAKATLANRPRQQPNPTGETKKQRKEQERQRRNSAEADKRAMAFVEKMKQQYLDGGGQAR